jgi:hypothetical protein
MNPTEMQWLREHMENDNRVREQALQFSLDKRRGFVKVYDSETTDPKYRTTHMLELSGMSYVYKRWTNGKGYIMKIINRKADYCGRRALRWKKVEPDDVNNGQPIGDFFDIHECNPLNMIKMHGPRNYKETMLSVTISNTADWIGQIDLSSYPTVNIDVYDYIFIYKGLLDQYKQIVNIAWPIITISWPRAWLEAGQSTQVDLKIFKEVGESIMVAWADGIRHISPDEHWFADEFTLLWSTQSLNNQPIKAIANFGWVLVFEKWGYIFFSDGWESIWSFWSSIKTTGNYDDIINVGQYLVAIWPSSIGVIYSRWIDNVGRTIPRMYEKWNFWWYRNRGSYLRESYWFDSRFVLHDSFWSLASYTIVPQDDWENVVFYFERADIGNRYVGTHLSMLTREGNERVYISEDDNWIKIFITYGEKEEGLWTKVLLFDRQQSFWYIWIINWINLVWELYWFWYGNKVFANEWDNDDGNPINQIISFSFGDITSYDVKKIFWLNMMLWYKTNIISDKTFVKHAYITGEWVASEWYYMWWSIGSRYIKLLNKYKWLRNDGIRDRGKLLEWMSLDRGVYGDGVVTKNNPIGLSLYNEIQIYKEMSDKTKEYIDDAPCLTEAPYQEVEKDCGDVGYQECKVKMEYEYIAQTYNKSLLDNYNDDYFKIAKYAQINIPMSKNSIVESTFTLFAGDGENFHFLWATIWFMQTDSDIHSRANEWNPIV